MTQSLWSKGMYSSSSICFDNFSTEHLPPFQSDLGPSNSDAPGVSVTSHKDRGSVRMLPDGQIYSCGDIAAGLLCFNQRNPNSSRESSAGYLSGKHTSPAPHGDDWNLNTGHQAKRARVENIIKGMICTDATTHQHQEAEYMQEDEASQDMEMSQKHMERNGCESTSQDLGKRKLHLRVNLRTADEGSESTNGTKEEKNPSWSDSSETSPSDDFTDSCNEFESSWERKYQRCQKGKLLNYFQSKPERIKLMADVLKCELSRAVSRSIDSIFRSIPLLQTSTHDAENSVTSASLQSSASAENNLRFPCCGTADMDIPDVQTEALSLVVQKHEMERPQLYPKSPIPFGHSSALHKDQPPERRPRADYQHTVRRSEAAQSKFNTNWNLTKVKSKVNSRSPQTHTLPMDPMLLESLSIPHVKTESDSLVKTNLYMVNEGLTTNHLKKAKLMFFYIRYPSSPVLRMCFHDVQFTRCITSQLIKWFSNFREFYYIQMEKFARSALMEGVVDVRDLTVGRESELFRALNMHYNKANDYQVPERFLEVAEITLREFYTAISTGKDRDPSWKKTIYKVICKLDSDVPSEFKIHHSA